MMKSKTVLVSLAAMGLLSAGPAFAADATRSAAALPASTSAAPAPASAGCVAPLGNGVANNATAPATCGSWSAGANEAGYYGAFGESNAWWILLLAAGGLTALVLLVTGDGNDSPG